MGEESSCSQVLKPQCLLDHKDCSSSAILSDFGEEREVRIFVLPSVSPFQHFPSGKIVILAAGREARSRM